MPAVTPGRQVRLFKNGRSQAVRIPREFELPGTSAMLHREKGGRLILEPVRKKRLTELLATWEPLAESDAMPPIEDNPAETVQI